MAEEIEPPERADQAICGECPALRFTRQFTGHPPIEPVSLVIWYAILLHLAWGATVLVDGRATMMTALAELRTLSPSTAALGISLLLIGGAALLSALYPTRRWALALVLPQQFALMMSAFGAVRAVAQRAFPDGVERPWAFILADQLPAILTAVLHTAALWRMYAREAWTSMRAGFFR